MINLSVRHFGFSSMSAFVGSASHAVASMFVGSGFKNSCKTKI